MSKKNQVNTVPEEESHEEVIETQTETTTEIEVVEEPAKENKALKFLKKAAPFAIIGGALAAVFALGHHSGSDAAYLAMLSDGSDEDESDDCEDADNGKEETENAQDE